MPRAPSASDAARAGGADASAQLPLFEPAPTSSGARLSQRIKRLFAPVAATPQGPDEAGSSWPDSFFDPAP